MTEMNYWSATETLAHFRAKDVSPVEVLDATVVRIAEVNGRVNAFSEQMLDEARDAAHASERRYAAGEPAGVLDGLLVAAKDEHVIEGRVDRMGSLLTDDTPADHSHPVIERVQAAGGIIHGRTTTPEFTLPPFTHSALWGVTRNPWNLDVTPGGSSGGSAAALAAGMATVATGSDIGGSIRIPASLCGLVGFKSPMGRIPADAPFNQDSYCTDGALARTVADAALMQNVLAGPHPRDHVSIRPAYVLPDTFESVEGMRIALCINLGDFVVERAIEENTRRAARLLEEAGAIVEEVTLPWRREKFAAVAAAHLGRLAGEGLLHIPEAAQELLMPYTREFNEHVSVASRALTLAETLAGESELYRPFGELLGRYDALICPTWPTQGLPAGEDLVDVMLEVEGRQQSWHQQVMTIPFNMLSTVPVLSVPSGLAPNGVPTGVQIAGRSFDDITPFRVGAALEAAQDLWGSTSWRPTL
ncbi:MAG: amidase [Rhodococcus erythropolis]|jgi:Asp-tRNA(Asn)/Glu-tRNA(Gln) amidotransferase A subunit family amidase|nr:amidase [Rhodococcus erythropolis]MDF2896881.1 amidase [Rhodococcus erythropolis]